MVTNLLCDSLTSDSVFPGQESHTSEGTLGARVSMISQHCFPSRLNSSWCPCFSLVLFSNVVPRHTCIYAHMHTEDTLYKTYNETAETRPVLCDKFMHTLYAEFHSWHKPVISSK